MKRKIELYGRLRDAGLGDSLVLDLPRSTSARQALALVKAVLGRKASLLEGCALATDDEILSSSDPIPSGRLALLPPVCGG